VAAGEEGETDVNTSVGDVGVVGVKRAAEVLGFASSVFTTLNTPVIRPPVIATTPATTAACTVTFCALYQRAKPICPPTPAWPEQT
jgi:hypothetical protein